MPSLGWQPADICYSYNREINYLKESGIEKERGLAYSTKTIEVEKALPLKMFFHVGRPFLDLNLFFSHFDKF